MNKWLVYGVGVLSAVVVAVILLVMAQGVLDISQESIVVGSLAFAGILSMACAVGALVRALIRTSK